ARTSPDGVRRARDLVAEGQATGGRAGAHQLVVYLHAATGPDAAERLDAERRRWGMEPTGDVRVRGGPPGSSAPAPRRAEPRRGGRGRVAAAPGRLRAGRLRPLRGGGGPPAGGLTNLRAAGDVERARGHRAGQVRGGEGGDIAHVVQGRGPVEHGLPLDGGDDG